ncbi:hypothetical protein DZ860_09030 [Vibrio sinensis]|uniref:ExoP galactose-binding-like domain-containing protein n=1 Tax=Vibrio sinensis TaxID=2302434 RepID=A0A3A6QSV9_9VIBR|nr:putative glycoside hydrolase [Vibrio sinensis]RJX71964.1 hypothetical protein DZ860_09030 [Vibrio sinensis]
MNKPVFRKTIVASALFSVMLTGCLDDPYNEPVTPPIEPPLPTETTVIYGPDSDGTFNLMMSDSGNIESPVDESGNSILGNIQTQNVSGQRNGTLNVKITGNQKARIALMSSDASHINLNIDPTTTTLQFDSRAISKALTTQDVFLTTQKESGTDIGKVSLTSSFLAYYNSAPQSIKVPLSCFSEAGMDFSNTITPFALESSDNLSFDMGNIRIVENSIEQLDVLECHSSSLLLEPDDPSDEFRASSLFKVGTPTTGWATAITNWMTVGNSLLHWGHDNIRIEYTNAPAGENGGLVLAISDGTPRDLSDYANAGVLQFMFNVSNYAEHPTKRFQIQMESSEFGNSQPYFLEVGTADNSWVQIQVPLRDLFTRADGSIDINALKNIDKPLSILPEWVGVTDTLQNMDFSISNVQIVVP